jgi:hypothetical protein
MKILLGDFNAKVGRENIFKPKIGNDNPHQVSNDNGVRIVNFAAFKTWLLRARCSPTETFISTPGRVLMGRPHSPIDHILIDRRRQSSMLDVRSFRRAHYLVVAKLRERLAVNKQAAQNFDGERFNLRKLNELEVKNKYQIEIKKFLQLWKT